MSKSKVVAMNGHVILRPIEETEEMAGPIVIPDLGKERPEMGEVVSVSKVYNFHTDNQVLTEDISEGDLVLIPKLGSSKISVSGETYYIVKLTDIYCKITED